MLRNVFAGIAVTIASHTLFVATLLQSEASNTQTGRIVNGSDVNPPFKYPAMLRMMWKGSPYCGATILNKYWALTAGHCVNSAPPKEFTLITGLHNFSKLEAHSQVVQVVETVGPRIQADIKLLRVEPPFIFNKNVSPINLPPCDFVVEEDGKTLAYAVGWGSNVSGRPNVLEVLQEVEVPLLTTDTCQRAYGFVNTTVAVDNILWNVTSYTALTEDSLCAGFLEGGKDACKGDSGGPLFTLDRSSNTYTQVGIVIGGFGCGWPGFPGIYMRVSKFLEFIRTGTQKCSPRRPKAIVSSLAH